MERWCRCFGRSNKLIWEIIATSMEKFIFSILLFENAIKDIRLFLFFYSIWRWICEWRPDLGVREQPLRNCFAAFDTVNSKILRSILSACLFCSKGTQPSACTRKVKTHTIACVLFEIKLCEIFWQAGDAIERPPSEGSNKKNRATSVLD